MMASRLTYSAIVLAAAVLLSGCVSTIVNAPATTPGSSPTPGQLLEPLRSGLIGGAIGKTLKDADRKKGLVAEYQALENSFGRTPVTWSGAQAGVEGIVTAGTPFRVGQQDCRPYTHEVIIEGKSASATGAACRQANGAWLRLD
jgi:surface antigen